MQTPSTNTRVILNAIALESTHKSIYELKFSTGKSMMMIYIVVQTWQVRFPLTRFSRQDFQKFTDV